MQIKLDFRSGVPIYVQIKEQIKRLVANGDLVPGEQLPTVRQLATDLRVNFNTIARAYRMLDDEGFISTQHGRGTYIWEPTEQDARKKMRRESLEGLTRWYLEEAEQQHYSPEEIAAVFEAQFMDWKNIQIRSEQEKDKQQKRSTQTR